MKRFITFLILLMFIFSFATVLATEKTSDEKDKVIYLNSYEEYQELLKSMDGSDEAKAGYLKTIFERAMYNIPAPTYKAMVLSVGEVKTEFDGDATNGYQMYVYQDMSVRILEGEYAGQDFDGCAYPLKVDSYYNMKREEINPGTVVYLSVYDDGENIYPYIQHIDASVSKVGFTALLFIIAVAMILIYTGKHGAKILLPIVLLVDLLFIVFADFVLNYIGVWAMFVGIILLTSIAFFAIRLGVNSKMGTAIISLTVILVVMTALLYGFDAITHISGLSYEASNLVEKVYPVIVGETIMPTIDFHALSVGITILLMAVILIPIIVKTIETVEKNSFDDKEELKKYLAEKILFVVSILIVGIVQKYLYVYLNVGSVDQIINSEILTIEVARILFVVIGMALSVTITEMVSKFLEN